MNPQVMQARTWARGVMRQMIFPAALVLAAFNRAELAANARRCNRVMENPATLQIHHNYVHRKKLMPTK